MGLKLEHTPVLCRFIRATRVEFFQSKQTLYYAEKRKHENTHIARLVLEKTAKRIYTKLFKEAD